MENCNDQLLDDMCPIFFFLKRVFYIRLLNAKNLTALKKNKMLKIYLLSVLLVHVR